LNDFVDAPWARKMRAKHRGLSQASGSGSGTWVGAFEARKTRFKMAAGLMVSIAFVSYVHHLKTNINRAAIEMASTSGSPPQVSADPELPADAATDPKPKTL